LLKNIKISSFLKTHFYSPDLVSKLSRIIVQLVDTAFLISSLGLRSGCQSNRWQTISVTSQFGDSQLGDVKSVTGVSQFGDSHNLLTNDIFRPYTSRVYLHLAKFIVENNF